MPIELSPELNRRLNKVVKNYNERVRRANKFGKIAKSKLPAKVKVRDLKKSYSNLDDLINEMQNLELFNRKDLTTSVTEHLSVYDINLLRQNRERAVEFFEKQVELLRPKAETFYPLKKARMETIQQNIEILKSAKTPEELRAASRYIDKYRKSFERQASGYRGFLSQTEAIMKLVGISKERRDTFFKKLSQLNEIEFMELYEKEDILNKIYTLADSPKYTGGELILYDSEENTFDLINSLINNIDNMISDLRK